MKSIARFGVLATIATLSINCHAVTYTFAGFFNENNYPLGADNTATFTLSTPSYVVSNASFAASSMVSCHTPVLQCASASFFIDAAAEGFTDVPDVQAITLTSTGVTTGYFYFSPSAFTTPGTHNSLFGFNPATLVVAVPELSGTAYMLLGLSIASFAVRRHRRSDKKR